MDLRISPKIPNLCVRTNTKLSREVFTLVIILTYVITELNNMMQSSKCDDSIIRTEFSGAPVRGKKGEFSTGPQEQLALQGMGMTRLVREVSLLRSDYCNVLMKTKRKEEEEEEEEEICGGSTTFKRMHDDLDMRGLNVTYKVKKLYE